MLLRASLILTVCLALHHSHAASHGDALGRRGTIRMSAPTPPTFPSSYKMTYMFSLPYVKTLQSHGLKYPVQVWYDGDNQKIRTDLYDGMDSIVWTEDYTYSVYPRIDTMKCAIVNTTVGPTAYGAEQVPPPLPDISTWTYGGTAKIRGTLCNAWRYILKAEEKVATYTFYTDVSNDTPVRLYMMGRNLLSGSHFDEYLVDIVSFKPLAADSDPFKPPKHCKDVLATPHDAHATHSPLAQAMSLLPSSHFPRQLSAKVSAPLTEQRWGTYLANWAAVRQWNQDNAGSSFRLGLNKFAFWDEQQYAVLRGRRSEQVVQGGKNVDEVYQRSLLDDELPAEVDWRGTGADGEVKDQATCGSCWAFAAVGAMQGAHFLATGEQLSLSEQQLVDCSWNHGGNSGCDGGNYGPAVHYVIKAGGMAQEEDYQYLGANAFCKVPEPGSTTKGAKLQKKPPTPATFAKFVKVPHRDEKALMEAVHVHGPVAVSLDASLDTFKFYTEGVYDDPRCKTKEDELDHAVLLVGYGTTKDGVDYWLIRNSWSKLWGEDGYIKIARKNDCGITTAAGFAVVDVGSKQ